MNRVKRIFDLLATICLLPFLFPLILLIGIVVRVKMGSPVIFRQQRPGFKGKPFTMYKFRSMTFSHDDKGQLLPDVERLTPLGSFLRKSSLDELPEFFNVLKGDMSLVGPRPLLMEYLDKYSPEQASRHDVRPGITGLTQISGRQDIPFSKRLEYDAWYVKNRNFKLDIKILLLTLVRVFRQEGVRPGQEVCEVDDVGLSSTAERFKEGD